MIISKKYKDTLEKAKNGFFVGKNMQLAQNAFKRSGFNLSEYGDAGGLGCVRMAYKVNFVNRSGSVVYIYYQWEKVGENQYKAGNVVNVEIL